ncbi:homoserine O-acetyltransferase [Hypoxylon fragiforme]|uniref:homoserine O-acetyltransferase n=1 Tax=Hypoxylon fragiforme TaxID=63214 RepID=UPI0020C6E673|nr:homoserine O-acetyltransferase [Hypoxylon fragiforme]KAI2612922.1 homoserine O-acetyltransferase [Hypoxylon fragiforme]
MAALLDYNSSSENYYASLIQGQRFAVIPELLLDSGEILDSCPIAYKTWGRLNETRDNVLVICHALTGSSDISDWWSPLLGRGKAFDPAHFFIFCANVLGSPYGSASPLTTNPRTGRPYASEFPQTTVRDDVRAHKYVLDALGVRSVAAVIGGSMGGMTTLEWPLCTEQGYVKSIIPIATAADHSAWGISWAEAQRQCIYSDPKFDDGYYEPRPEGQPSAGLAAARMVAMLTYRSCVSFDARFGRKPQRQQKSRPVQDPPLDLPRTDVPVATATPTQTSTAKERSERQSWAARRDPSFSAQGYLHYQGQKFIQRFDANCYLHITNKMDAHDVTLGRVQADEENGDGDSALRRVLAVAPPGALVVSVETDALFLPEQQERLAACLPNATLAMLKSSDGHDGFLLEFEQLGTLILEKLRRDLPQFYGSVDNDTAWLEDHAMQPGGDSLTGEVESW